MTDNDEISQLQERLTAHRRTLATLLTQQAQLGADYAPPGIAHGIADARAAIQRLKTDLRASGVTVHDLPDDRQQSAIATASSVPSPRSGGINIDRSTINGDVVHGIVNKTINQYAPSQPTHSAATLEAAIAALQVAAARRVPIALQSEAHERAAWIEKALRPDTLDLALLESAVQWFRTNAPATCDLVLAILNHSTVTHRVAVADKAANFQQRFSGLTAGKE